MSCFTLHSELLYTVERLAGVRTASRRKAALEEAEKAAEEEVIPTEEPIHEEICFTMYSN